MQADSLSPGLWNAITDLVRRQEAPAEISFHQVKKRDLAKKVIWVEEFGETGIPLVSFDSNFSYWAMRGSGNLVLTKIQDTTPDQTDPALRTNLLVPRVGQMVAILNPSGNRRFPICVGVLQSALGTYWQGE